MWLRSLWNWFVGGVWKGLEMSAREALRYCELRFKGDFDLSLEDKTAHRNADNDGQAQDI